MGDAMNKKKYFDRVNLFRDLIKTENDNIDFYLCEKLLENFIEMNLIYNIINSCEMTDFEIHPCEYSNQDMHLHFIIKALNNQYINAITSFIDQNNNTIYYGRNKEPYKVNCQPEGDLINIYFIGYKKEG
jgi:hypothetical protein